MTHTDPYDQQVEQNFEQEQVREFVRRVPMNMYRAIRNVYVNAFYNKEIHDPVETFSDKLWKTVAPIAELNDVRREDMPLIIKGRDFGDWELSMIKDLQTEADNNRMSIAKFANSEFPMEEISDLIIQIESRIERIYYYAVINKQLYED